jgi:hypothetical protein
MPWKSLRRMMFTTPDTASEPYSAEAPPVRTSTWSTIWDGIWLVSTSPVLSAGTRRLPSTRTRVRFTPRLRRSTVAIPAVPLSTVLPSPSSTVDGSERSVWPMLVEPWSLNSCWPTAETGLVEYRPCCGMREPVTTTTSPVGVSCAIAGRPSVAADAAPRSSTDRSLRDFKASRDILFPLEDKRCTGARTPARSRHWGPS